MVKGAFLSIFSFGVIPLVFGQPTSIPELSWWHIHYHCQATPPVFPTPHQGHIRCPSLIGPNGHRFQFLCPRATPLDLKYPLDHLFVPAQYNGHSPVSVIGGKLGLEKKLCKGGINERGLPQGHGGVRRHGH